MMNLNTYNPIPITVEGRGLFPTDMLRYDQCAPVGPDDVAAIHPEVTERRQVKLNAFTKYITPARWESFGWNVVYEGLPDGRGHNV